MYVFYTPINSTTGRVTSILEDSQTPEELKTIGIYVDLLPAIEDRPGFAVVMDIDLVTHAFSIDYQSTDQADDMVTLRLRLDEAESKLRTADEYYQSLNLNTVTLDELKQAKKDQLEFLCDQATEAGFLSASTGFRIGFSKEDQDNLGDQALLFLSNPEKIDCQWKTEDAGVQLLTRAQFMGLLPEGETHKRTLIGKLWTLNGSVTAAADKSAVSAIVW